MPLFYRCVQCQRLKDKDVAFTAHPWKCDICPAACRQTWSDPSPFLSQASCHSLGILGSRKDFLWLVVCLHNI